jgi:hypothetical protein
MHSCFNKTGLCWPTFSVSVSSTLNLLFSRTWGASLAENLGQGILKTMCCVLFNLSIGMEALCSSKTLVTTYKTTRHHNREDHYWHVFWNIDWLDFCVRKWPLAIFVYESVFFNLHNIYFFLIITAFWSMNGWNLFQGGTGYSTTNTNLEAKHERPVLQAWNYNVDIGKYVVCNWTVCM